MSEKSESKPHKPLVVVEPKTTIPTAPDEFTRKDPTFFDGGAPGQIFKFEKWGLSYGTDDKGHAAAIILSVLIVSLLGLVFIRP